MNESVNPLQVYLPGSCAQLVPELQAAFSEVSGAPAFIAAKIDQTGHLAQAIIDGEAVDVFMSANTAYMEQVRNAGLLAESRVFARNALCILVRHDLTDLIQGVPDLLRDDVQTLLCPSGSDPCGQYTVAMFERAGFGPDLARQKARGTIRELGPNVAFTLLNSGDADAIVIYRSFGTRMPELELVELDLPYSMDDRIEFAVGAIQRDDSCHPDAITFLNFLTGSEAASILKANDFLPLE